MKYKFKIQAKTFIVKSIMILLIIIVSGTSTLILLPHFINPASYKKFIITEFTKATGRQLIISGPIKLSLFPDIHVHVSKVNVTSPSQLSGNNFIYINSLDFHISLLYLIAGTIKISKLNVYDMKLNLVQNKQLNNWNFGTSKSNKGKSFNSYISLILEKISFSNLKVAYMNLTDGQSFHSKPFNLNINTDDGYIELKNEYFKLNNTTLDFNNIFYSKTNFLWTTLPNYKYNGSFIVNDFSLIKVADVLGVVLSKELNIPAYSNISASSNLQLENADIKLTSFKLRLGNTQAVGNIKISPNIFKISHNLEIHNVNVDEFVYINGFKLKLESVSLNGVIASKDGFNTMHLNGKENVGFTQAILYGLNINKFSAQATKAANDILILKRLVTYTKTAATIKSLKQTIEKINGNGKKDYTSVTNLGVFNSDIIIKDGVISVSSCKLNGSSLLAYCGGYLDIQKSYINFIVQGRIKPQTETSFINYIYFPYYIRGNIFKSSTGLNWGDIIEQTAKYYSTSEKDKPILNKTLDNIGDLFKHLVP